VETGLAEGKPDLSKLLNAQFVDNAP
jgi:hypothetical protein